MGWFSMRNVAWISAALGAAGLLLAAAPAAATTIDFETGAPCLFNQTSPLGNEYAGQGVTFSGVGAARGGSILDQCSNFGIDAHSGVDFLAFAGALGGPSEDISFSDAVSRDRKSVV